MRAAFSRARIYRRSRPALPRAAGVQLAGPIRLWIRVALTVIVRGTVMRIGGFTTNSGTGCPAASVFAGMISGGWPDSKIGTSIA